MPALRRNPRRKYKDSKGRTRIVTKGLSGGRRKVMKYTDSEGLKRKKVEVSDRYGNIKKTKSTRRGKDIWRGASGYGSRKVKVTPKGKKTVHKTLTKFGPERLKGLKRRGAVKRKYGEMQSYAKGGKLFTRKKTSNRHGTGNIKTYKNPITGNVRTVEKFRTNNPYSGAKKKIVTTTKKGLKKVKGQSSSSLKSRILGRFKKSKYSGGGRIFGHQYD